MNAYRAAVGCLCGLLLPATPLRAEELPSVLSRFSTSVRLGGAYKYTSSSPYLQALVDPRLNHAFYSAFMLIGFHWATAG